VWELEIGDPTHGGACVARHEGRVVFVRHTLPGELVRARVTAVARTFAHADAVEVLRASPDRVTPPCLLAGPGKCGGCDSQHVSVSAQRRNKGMVVAEQLHRIAGIARNVNVEELPGNADGLGWRTRQRYAVDSAGVVGFRAHRSRRVVPVNQCLLSHPNVEKTGVTRRRWEGAAEVMVTAAGTPPQTVVAVRRAAGSGVRPVRVSGPSVVTEQAAGRQWSVAASGFWQVHPAAADTLAGVVVEALDPRPGESALDLYGGVGVFGGVLAQRLGATGRLVIVEANAEACRHARMNLADLSAEETPHVDVVCATVDQALSAQSSLPHIVDVVVLDPPRSGAGRSVVMAITAKKPRSVAYVSCDAATLARDVAVFVQQGYQLTALRVFDAFPMTSHVECVALLVKSDSGLR
jgi:tRNA/tmRNA/rRNA uracil-C5-methylase (TrmA/RlmC/RlmD family)